MIRKTIALLLASFMLLLSSLSTSALASPATRESFSANVVLANPNFGEARIWPNPRTSGFHIRDLPIDLTITETSVGSFFGVGNVIYDADWTADASEGGTGRVTLEGDITDGIKNYYVLFTIMTDSGYFLIRGDGIRITGTYTSTGELTGVLTGVKRTYPQLGRVES